MKKVHRREFLQRAALMAGACAAGNAVAQVPGERPPAAPDVTVLNPRNRVPVGIIIDDSTCLVNLNRFAAPQFAQVLGPESHHARLPWREWPVEIPDAFVRKFGEWGAEHGVKGKYSIVPFPACVGRLDREIPGWTQKELKS
ncbi:MAG: twin-arginine translocation signal domain-containing protein, partial [Chthoniobacteraceae bacterium]